MDLQGGGFNLQGATGLQAAPSQLQPAVNVQAPQAHTATLGATNTGGTYAGTGVNNVAGTAGYSLNQPEYLAGIQQEYNSAIQGGNTLLGQNAANLPINQGLLNAYVGAQENSAQSQADNQVNTYNTQKSGVQSQQQLSLAQLADQIRGQNQGLQSQLGAVGAGASSAAGLGQVALAREQNMNRANIQQQTGSNLANIDAQIQQTQNTLHPYLQTLEAYKNQQTQQILQNYNTLQGQLEQQIGQSQGEEKARLAMFGQQLSASAGAALSSLGQQIANASQTFAGQQQAALANRPGDFQAPALAAAPSAIQAPTVSPFTVGQPAANSTATPTGGSLATLFKQQQ